MECGVNIHSDNDLSPGLGQAITPKMLNIVNSLLLQ